MKRSPMIYNFLSTRYIAEAKTTYELVTINWEVDVFSGSTTCEAWRVQYELDCFYQAGYKVVSIDGFIIPKLI